jgi:predicted dehydrogenase
MFDALIVGCGRMAGYGKNPRNDSYAMIMDRFKLLNLIAAVDVSDSRVQEFATQYGCQPESDIVGALDLYRPDVVIVTTPDNDHTTSLLQILKHANRPRAIIVEKPLCISPQELAAIEAVRNNMNVGIFVNHSRRLDPRYRRLRAEIRKVTFGDPVKVRCIYYGGWLHNGIHLVDTLAFLFDKPPKWTSCSDVKRGRTKEDPSWSLIGTFPGTGIQVEIEAVDESFYQLFELDFRFKDGRVLVNDFEKEFRSYFAEFDGYPERVLKPGGIDSVSEMSGTERLMSLVVRFLEGDVAEELTEISLGSAASSMASLFEGERIAKLN